MRKWSALLLLSALSSFGAEATVDHSTPVEEFLKVRDPFKRPALGNVKMAVKSELEMFASDTFKLVGVMTGPERMRAMLLAPNGSTHLVHEQLRIGLRNGVIRKIDENSILIREKMVNLLGQEESVETTLSLQPGEEWSDVNAEKPTAAPDKLHDNSRNELHTGNGIGAGSP